MVRVGECPPVITLCPAAIILPELMFYSGIFNIQTWNMPQILQECFCKAIGFVWKIREGSWLLICSRLQVFRDGGTLTLIGLGRSPRMMQTHFIFVALFLQREKEREDCILVRDQLWDGGKGRTPNPVHRSNHQGTMYRVHHKEINRKCNCWSDEIIAKCWNSFHKDLGLKWKYAFKAEWSHERYFIYHGLHIPTRAAMESFDSCAMCTEWLGKQGGGDQSIFNLKQMSKLWDLPRVWLYDITYRNCSAHFIFSKTWTTSSKSEFN